MSERIRTYVAVTAGAAFASAVIVYLSVGMGNRSQLVAASFFSLLVMLAHLLRYEGSRSGATGSIAFLPILACIVTAPTAITPLAVAATVILAELAARRPGIRIVFNGAQLIVACSAAILVVRPFSAAGLAPVSVQSIVGLSASALVFHALNSSMVAGAIALDSRRRFAEVWSRGAVRTLPYDVLALPVVYLLAWGYHEYGAILVFLFLLPVLGLRQLYKLNWELERANEEHLHMMVRFFEAGDPYTSGHSRRVSNYAVRIGKRMRLSAHNLEQLRVAALLHDVGKIHEEFAPVLRKAGRLTAAERRLIETHPIRSAELAATVSRLKPIIPALRSHHERWDGRGYPDRLAADAIPLFARIIAVADTVDAMTSTRPYRTSLDIEAVREEVAGGRGAQFDPAICDLLLDEDTWAAFAESVEIDRPEPPGVRLGLVRSSLLGASAPHELSPA